MALLWYAVTGMVFVMAILAGLCVLTALLSKISKRGAAAARPELPEPGLPARAEPEPAKIQGPEIPQIELIETDEATAAVIMAIVAERSGIPPERLDFKRVRFLNDGGTP